MRPSFTPSALLAAAAVTLAVPLLANACSSSGDLFPPDECQKQGAPQCTFGCSPNQGCVECGANSDCGAASPFCISGHCEQCAQTSDCGTGQACYPREHTCQPACVSNGSCNDKEPLCDPNDGACVGCINEKDCPATAPICNPTNSRCVRCASDSDCGAAAPVCDFNEGECVGCILDSQCDGGTCADHHCTVACKSNSDCGGGTPLCRTDGRCVACIAPTDCGVAAPFCAEAGQCVVCRSNADCTNPALAFCDGGDACVQCLKSEDCQAGMQCKDRACVTKG
jgi:hypothetical protein